MADRVAPESLENLANFPHFHQGDKLKELVMPTKATQSELKRLFVYVPSAGDFFWRNQYSGRKKGDPAGTKLDSGYIRLHFNNKFIFAHRAAWLYHHGFLPENQIDHINRNRADNRIKNLRLVSAQCNIRNTGNFKHNVSGVKGVLMDKTRGKWRAEIKVNQKNKFLGRYSSFINAVCARLAGEQCLNWGGCDNESPAYKYVAAYIKECREKV